MSHTVIAIIDKLRMWNAGEWKKYNINESKQTIFIRFHYDQLFILSENKVLESINLNGKIKGVYKDDVLILITCNALQQVRKIKFRVKTNISECFQKLNLHFPVVSYNIFSNSQHPVKYKNVEEILRDALNEKGTVIGPALPSNFKDFVKLCLLDPSFPNVIDVVQDIVKTIGI